MQYRRMPIEVESPEQLGYSTIQYNLAESSIADVRFGDLQLDLNDPALPTATISASRNSAPCSPPKPSPCPTTSCSLSARQRRCSSSPRRC